MTTIAFDGITMAADGRATAEDVILADDLQKLHRLETNRWSGRPVIIGMAGVTRSVPGALAWIEGLAEQPGENADFAALVWDGERLIMVSDECLTPESWPAPMAIGSGKIPALAAMRAGANAPRAVEVAITMDVYSGGCIRTVVL
ncbi:hypothetical protein B0T37_10545 [Chromobacterium violaceum]|uniref:hypothetical protein n=1 Tax=Chromobacterium violaceum TaxID=536 RepID=UPI0009DACA10|nr:hypothetical protein [Chromobacterium violaceum]OQS10079.1 hypothetical protein B0T38_10940 [Chromobacterium violaceum]OQS26494.1 hypothetical protein B0T37_10545 [Chromobacterium violaceum]